MVEHYWEHSLVYGHRGAPTLAPENTLPSFRAALDLGVDGIEMDVMLCASGEVVVIHDHLLDVKTDGEGLVERKTLPELKELDAGSSFSPSFAGTKIPTLREVFDLVGNNALMDIELKNWQQEIHTDGLEAKVVALVEEYHLEQKVLISSFNPFCIWRVKRLNPRLATGLCFRSGYRGGKKLHWINRMGNPFAVMSRPMFVHPEHDIITPQYCYKARCRGFRINAWTVNDPVEMERLVDLRLEGIITDEPAKLIEIVNKRRFNGHGKLILGARHMVSSAAEQQKALI